MKAFRLVLNASACALAAIALVPAGLRAQSNTYPHETATLRPIDAGRPWGWAVRDFMENPDRPLYNTAKAKLLRGEQLFSHTISSLDVDRYCQEAPHYDFTWFEMQHSTMTWSDIERMIAACPRVGATPMIRMPDALEANIQKAVDIGALGIIVPTVDDVFEARDAALFSRFPPAGRRSSGAGQAQRIWNPAVPQGSNFRASINDNMLVVVMIETLEGVQNALEIASYPGVDVVILGNADLTNFSGFPANDPRYQDLLLRVRNATYQAGKFWGNANQGLASGNPLSADSRFHQNGRSNDGWSPTGAGGRGGGAGGAGGRGGAAAPGGTATPGG
jgi:2-keto-3-deoxy-L-rhamnonate aldolase RhmA